MIKRLRAKFITVTMVLVAVMLLLIFFLVCHTTHKDLIQDNLHILHQLDKGPKDPPPHGKLPDMPSPMPNLCMNCAKESR